MTGADYIKISIGDFEIEATDPKELPVSIDYSLEDETDFQKKTSANALSIETPATLNNSKAANTAFNPSVQDFTNGEIFKSFQPAKIVANGEELLVGKGILTSAKHTNIPTGYKWDLHGDNANWLIDMKELTLFDILKRINFTFNKANIISSWAFTGLDENLPYVFAPVRYRDPFNGYQIVDGKSIPQDNTIPVDYMKPSLSKYFIIYWAFQSLGYKLSSNFFETNYYRRMVMPWAWGNFLNSEGTRLDVHKFLAKSAKQGYYDSPNGAHDFIFDLFVTNDSTDGAFDNNDDYSYDAINKAMVWQYKPPYYGNLQVTFSLNIDYAMHCTGNSNTGLYVQWYKNGVLFNGTNGAVTPVGNTIDTNESSGLGGTKYDSKTMFATVDIAHGDIISAKIHIHTFESKIGTASVTASVLQFQIDYFSIPVGGTIDFENYTGLKKFKFLDFLSGEVDNYNLSFKTDNLTKTILIEPTHEYSLTSDLSVKSGGFFKNDIVDWNDKADYSKEWTMEPLVDGSKERIIKFKNDSGDGLLKVVQDRHITTLAASKYVLPDRFTEGVQEVENRFFAPTMHYEVDQFAQLGTGTNTGIAPQMIALIPENISNTSNSEAANTFIPKSAYFKGLVTGVGAWSFDNEVLQNYPYMFAVNYKDGGENDPILSYSDEKIKSGSGYVLGFGLFKRYYWQRFAIMRNGQWYTVYMRLLNSDVSNQMHREYKKLNGHRWELVNIRGFRPLANEASQCLIRRFEPITEADLQKTFPSAFAVMDNDVTHYPADTKYNPLICLNSDIPK